MAKNYKTFSFSSSSFFFKEGELKGKNSTALGDRIFCDDRNVLRCLIWQPQPHVATEHPNVASVTKVLFNVN